MLRRKKLEEPATPEAHPHTQPDHAAPHRPTIEQELEVIYGDSEGQGAETIDFTRLEVRKKSTFTRILIWLIATIGLLALVAWAGFLLFQNLFAGTDRPLALDIQGPTDITSGNEALFDIAYENSGDVPLASLEIKLSIPEGFEVTSLDPAPTSEPYIWTIGSMTAGSDDIIRLKGVWIDPVPSAHTLQAIATYRPANFNADFQDITTHSISVSDSALLTTFTGTETSTPGNPISYVYTLKNTSTKPLQNLRVRFTFPDALLVQSSDPAPTEGTKEWVIAELAPETEFTITVNGQYASDANGLYTLNAKSGMMRNDRFLEQSTTDAQTDVVGGGVALRLIVNGSADDQTADLGKTLRLSIDVTNGEETEIGGLSMALQLTDARLIDWSTANLSGGVRSENIITWKSDTLSKLGLLPGGERETVDLSLPLLGGLNGASDRLAITATADVSTIGGNAAPRSISSSPLTIAINTEAALEASAYYYIDGTPVGSGPLPPQVDGTTSYRLVWSIKNSVHALDEVLMTATIPPTVSYLGDKGTDIGTLTFDEATRLLTWKIDRLPTSVPSVNAVFDLAITPTSGDVGTFVKLQNESILSATDSATGARLQRTGNIITTDLDDDLDAAGKGAVVE